MCNLYDDNEFHGTRGEGVPFRYWHNHSRLSQEYKRVWACETERESDSIVSRIFKPNSPTTHKWIKTSEMGKLLQTATGIFTFLHEHRKYLTSKLWSEIWMHIFLQWRNTFPFFPNTRFRLTWLLHHLIYLELALPLSFNHPPTSKPRLIFTLHLSSCKIVTCTPHTGKQQQTTPCSATSPRDWGLPSVA